MEKQPQIKFDQVSKVYPNDIVALDRVTFEITPGEFAFIIGPSGAGKSTIMKLLIRQELPSYGDITFENVEVSKIPSKMLFQYRQKLGIVFQDLKLIPSKTVEENIQFALEITDKSKEEINETTKYLMDVVKIGNRAQLFPDQLSGGEKQKVAIARALANDPKLFIADEPTGNLDPENSIEILNILHGINEWGTTVIVITHDDYIVDALQTRVIRMEKGRLSSDEKGGYFQTGEMRKEVFKKLEDLDIPKLEQKESPAKDDNHDDGILKNIIKSKSIRKKLKKSNVNEIDAILDLTEDHLKKIGLTDEEVDKLSKDLESYLESK